MPPTPEPLRRPLGARSQEIGSESPAIRHADVRVLVVDDEESVRDLMLETFRLAGIEATGAEDGGRALELCRDTFFDVVFVDLVMPGKGGREVLKELALHSPDSDVVVITGYGTIETAVECMKLGAADFVTKPFSTTHLMMVLGKVLERRRLIRAAREREYYKRLSRLDGLTELYNHRFFHQLVDSEVSRARRFKSRVSLLMVDVDHFKQYNDANGHPAGDEALKQVATLLSATCRKYDFIARYGGEEFAILSPGNESARAAALAERIRATIEAEEFRGESALPSGVLTVSIGIATFPESALDKQSLIEHADRALYAAKSRGRNCVVVFDESMKSTAP